MHNENLPMLWTTRLAFKREEEQDFPSTCCLCYSDSFHDYLQTKSFLHPKERVYFSQLQFNRRIKSYLAGRYAGKNAVSLLSGEEKLSAIAIEPGIFHQPVVHFPGRSAIQVTISHCDDLGMALAYPDTCPLGVDIERLQADKQAVLAGQMTAEEHGLIQSLPFSSVHSLTLFWTVKESLSKVLKTGFTSPIDIFAIRTVEVAHPVVTSYFENFPQYCATSFFFTSYICSITHPKGVDWPKDSIYRLLSQVTPVLERINT
ncbi:4'-phosphopantetheinyl transferase superfamily protein [Bacillus inaquosorum]|uniref:4'-phosphopantetheinyl transferase superfamily protein n=2 Tax=Bacillus inaquosorum TaxID=483913 RepID=UPI000745D782|nr:4'-phosphopantetheinyl transferase superfamily protein [Bacillus inaquosorum]CAF1860441.1 hypothetical protein NRS6167_04146 [Bacillus subtilis]AMA52845.1 hypothetical protein AN935_11395 [Bacillus inaquosorum]MBT2193487.1 4'-phosphopantetheinyl transferase superfamily protein [Bacillus inaquosorum]MBT3120239.1 4'-phosphopantetheinyl transferase superfamily protein [Bacillus inaquosorum]MBT3124560.1 4'-phosphopantetheinyl transferase superfamily protein [Bacillus inaquosorum]